MLRGKGILSLYISYYTSNIDTLKRRRTFAILFLSPWSRNYQIDGATAQLECCIKWVKHHKYRKRLHGLVANKRRHFGKSYLICRRRDGGWDQNYSWSGTVPLGALPTLLPVSPWQSLRHHGKPMYTNWCHCWCCYKMIFPCVKHARHRVMCLIRNSKVWNLSKI